MWVFGTRDGVRVRQSLRTVNWEQAEDMLRALDPHEPVKKITVPEACDKFIEYCEAKQLAGPTIKKYKLLTKELKVKFPDVPIARVSVANLDAYRKSWKMQPSSSAKKLERLRKFFRFCLDREWIKKNPALNLEPPKVVLNPTMPFNADEIEKIIWATEIYPEKYRVPVARAQSVRAFVFTLMFTGLRIGDAVALGKDRIQDGKLLLYTQKTKVPVWLPLPEGMMGHLEKVQTPGPYYFWSGNGELESAVKDWQRTLRQLFKLAGVKGHAHQFRDFFATELLKSGVSLETVSVLLGHQNIRVTQKHYNPWIQSRQEALEREVKKAWKLT